MGNHSDGHFKITVFKPHPEDNVPGKCQKSKDTWEIGQDPKSKQENMECEKKNLFQLGHCLDIHEKFCAPLQSNRNREAISRHNTTMQLVNSSCLQRPEYEKNMRGTCNSHGHCWKVKCKTRTTSFKQAKTEAREMVCWARCLLQKMEDLNSNHQSPYKKWAYLHMPVTSSAGEGETGRIWELTDKSVYLKQWPSDSINEETLYQKEQQRKTPDVFLRPLHVSDI